MDTEFETPLPRGLARSDNPDRKWIVWAIYAMGSLILALTAIIVLQIDSGILLGWAVGVIVAATLTVFGRQ